MTRIESIFGGILAIGILAVFAFVFFGGVEAAPKDSGARGSVLASGTTAALRGEAGQDYVAPSTPCECYNLGYDMVRERFEVGGVTYESQLQVCYDRLARVGAAAFDAGASDGGARDRRSCRDGDYL